jgi:formylglycine-generating enzyme required for sulfatase activity
MVEVPSGSFVMGSDANYPEESPAHEEHAAAFVIYQHPVANAEFRRFVSEAGYRTTATRPSKTFPVETQPSSSPGH